jgi:hypothetical protein
MVEVVGKERDLSTDSGANDLLEVEASCRRALDEVPEYEASVLEVVGARVAVLVKILGCALSDEIRWRDVPMPLSAVS